MSESKTKYKTTNKLHSIQVLFYIELEQIPADCSHAAALPGLQCQHADIQQTSSSSSLVSLNARLFQIFTKSTSVHPLGHFQILKGCMGPLY